MTLDSIRNSCDVYNKIIHFGGFKRPKEGDELILIVEEMVWDAAGAAHTFVDGLHFSSVLIDWAPLIIQMVHNEKAMFNRHN